MKVGGLELFLGTGVGVGGQMDQHEHLIFGEIMVPSQVLQDRPVLVGQSVAGVDHGQGFICVVAEDLLGVHACPPVPNQLLVEYTTYESDLQAILFILANNWRILRKLQKKQQRNR